MKTTVYVDGYNLFYGCLQHGPYKWLDVHTLFARIVHEQTPSATIACVKYFTAPIRSKVASRGNAAMAAQQAYHRALKIRHPDCIEIIEGYYALEKANLLAYQQPPDKNHRVEVWKLEEKQTDVSIALGAYRDASAGRAEQLVFVSNDSDLVPALQALRDDFGDRHAIGLVMPMRKKDRPQRPGNDNLSQLADWTRRYILDDELAASQLPDMIPTRRKPIRRPEYW